jgi:CDP-paratose 2-epimerase
MNREESATRVDRVVITGGAGFIGSNTAEHYLRAGARVTILDNFSRRGSESNAEWLQQSLARPIQVTVAVPSKSGKRA